MRAKVKAVYLGSLTKSFDNKSTGEKVEYRRAQFDIRGKMDTFVLGMPLDFDASLLKEYQDAYLLIDFAYDAKFNNFKGRLVNLYPDEKTWLAAPELSQAEEREAAASAHHV